MSSINHSPQTIVRQTTETVTIDGVAVPLQGYYYLDVNGTSFCPPDLTVTKTNMPNLVTVTFTATECLDDLDYTPEQKEAMRRFYSAKLEELLEPGSN